jgi:hypothetical protein
MPPPLDTKDILAALLKATNNGSLEWQVTPDDVTFQGTLDNGSVRISPYGLGGYLIELFDTQGRRLEQRVAKGPEDLEVAGPLYGLIRQKVLRLEDSVGRLLEDILRRAEKP